MNKSPPAERISGREVVEVVGMYVRAVTNLFKFVSQLRAIAEKQRRERISYVEFPNKNLSIMYPFG